MRKIGIIAHNSERVNKKKWWEFWKKNSDCEEVVFEELNATFLIVYVPKLEYQEYAGEIEEYFKDEGISECIFSDIMNIGEEDDTALERSMLPKRVETFAKKHGVNTRECCIAIQCDTQDLNTILSLARICRHLTIIAENTQGFSHISDRVFAETGLIIEVESETTLQKSQYDYLLKFNGEIVDSRNGKTSKPSIYSKKIPILNVKVNYLRMLKVLWKSGIIMMEDIEISA